MTSNTRTNDFARPRRTERGYNLVEVLVAVALTGVVVLTILTLFFMGRRNVYSGKQLSAANAVTTRVLEDLTSMSGQDVLANFGIDDSTTRSTNVVAGVSYANSILRDTGGTVTSAIDPSGYLTRWQGLVSAASVFQRGRFILVITPANPTVVGNPVTTAQVIRVRGVMQWDEGVRRRTVTFDDSKLVRP
jgi:prepilin-type N-terminal cleavage/methylation domain-containing protein